MSARSHFDCKGFRGSGRCRRNQLSPEDIYTPEEVIGFSTGVKVDETSWMEAQAKRHRVADRSHQVASLLEKAGCPALRQSHVAWVGLVTGLVETPEAYVACNLIPAVAQRAWAPLIPAFEYMCEHVLGDGARVYTATVTTGPRVPIGALRQTIRQLNRCVSKFSCEISHQVDVEVLLRAAQFTVATDSDTAEASFHVHAHLLLVGPKDWRIEEVLTRRCRTFFGSEQDPPQAVVGITEAVRYCLRPPFLEGELPNAETILAIKLAVERLKLVQPMGVFAEFLRELDKDGLKVVAVRTVNGSSLELVKKHRRRKPAGKGYESRGHASLGSNRVLSISLPSTRGTPWAEPYTAVFNYDPETFDLEATDPRVRRVTEEAWAKNGAPSAAETRAIAEALRATLRPKQRSSRERAASDTRFTAGRPTVRADDGQGRRSVQQVLEVIRASTPTMGAERRTRQGFRPSPAPETGGPPLFSTRPKGAGHVGR